MPARSWQSPFSRRRIISEHILNLCHLGLLTLRHLDLDDIEPPWQVPTPQPAQPFVRAALDQGSLLAVHGGKPADLGVLLPCLHLNEKKLPPFPCHDIHLPSPPTLKIPSEYFGIAGAQPVGCDVLAVVTRPLPRAAGSLPLPVGRVEIPAETSDDDSGKAHVS